MAALQVVNDEPPERERVAGDIEGEPLEVRLPGARPQFEAGLPAVGKGGIVRKPADRKKAVEKVHGFIEDAGWMVVGEIASPILGGSGNEEFLIGARHGA